MTVSGPVSKFEAHPQCILCERRAQSVANSLGWPVLVIEDPSLEASQRLMSERLPSLQELQSRRPLG